MDGHVKLIIVVAAAIILSYFALQARPADAPADATTACKVDADCVPAQCCHPTDAANKQFAPDCKGTFCTAYCAPNTLDCGQGEIKCVKSKCEVILK